MGGWNWGKGCEWKWVRYFQAVAKPILRSHFYFLFYYKLCSFGESMKGGWKLVHLLPCRLSFMWQFSLIEVSRFQAEKYFRLLFILHEVYGIEPCILCALTHKSLWAPGPPFIFSKSLKMYYFVWEVRPLKSRFLSFLISCFLFFFKRRSIR